MSQQFKRARQVMAVAAVGGIGFVLAAGTTRAADTVIGAGASAVEASPPLFDPAITRVAVFKNGYVFTFREGEARPADGWAATRQVPTGVLGTVWGYSLTPGVTVSQLSASETERTDSRPVSSLQELLLRNEGSNVQVTTTDKQTLTGVLQVLTPHAGTLAEGETADSSPAGSGGYEVVLKTDHGLDLLDLSKVAHIDIVGKPQWDVPVKVRQPLLSMKLDGATGNAPAKVGVAALEKGIRWVPGYRVTLQGDQQARVELEAEVVNDLADIKGGEFYFVVGVPHFLMDSTISPLSLRTAFTGLSGWFNDGVAQAAMTQQAMSNGFAPGGASDLPATQPLPSSSVDDAMPALSAEQMFLYQAPHLSLKRGERTSLRLFSTTVPVKPVYEWTIVDSAPAAPRGYGTDSSPTDLVALSDRIWYALKLTNSTTMPWTTGPAASFTDWKPLGQDMMPFTAPGGEAILKVTPATEVLGDHSQDEKARQRQAKNIDGYQYDLVTVEGTIKLRNVAPKPVTVCITRKTDGEILSATDGGKIAKEGLELQAVNPHSVITWEIPVPPGEKEVHYTYRRYVRS